ncbi:hypothetical protein [Dactylosporangium sp. NPDC048998]|uniref:hypothetical protein n=1 Tax=Dactylosporangium sp. NPDC048998 TaxID=3363976 RepID=UPI0037201890
MEISAVAAGSPSGAARHVPPPVGVALLAGMATGVALTMAAVVGLVDPRTKRFVRTPAPASTHATVWSWSGWTPPAQAAAPNTTPSMAPNSDPAAAPNPVPAAAAESGPARDGWAVP